METISIAIPALERGGEVRVMSVRPEELSPAQREALDSLPTNRAGTMRVLRGPAKTSKVAAHLVESAGGEPVVADFEFPVPAQVIEADIPGLLDVWRTELGKRRQYLIAREAKRATKPPKPRRKAAKGVEVETADAAATPVVEPTADNAEQPAPAEDVAHVLRCLPLLRAIEVEPIAGPDALILGEHVWSAVTRVVAFNEAGYELDRVDRAIDEALGPAWRDAECVEDIDLRVSQAVEDTHIAHAEFLAYLAGTRAKAEKPAAPATDAEKPAKRKAQVVTAPLVSGVVPLMDLAREVFIDVCTAQHSARTILSEPEAYTEWAQMFAKCVARVATLMPVQQSLQTFDVGVRLDLLQTWSQEIGDILVTPQMALWAQADQRRLQRTLEPQILRARTWKRAWHEIPAEVAAAVALLMLVR